MDEPRKTYMSPETTEMAAQIKKRAKRSCRHCHGTGFMGARVVSQNERSLISCVCVAKAVKREIEARRELLKSQAPSGQAALK